MLRRLEFHYVPKHASWLNMVEIEIGVLAGQCLDRRIESQRALAAEIAAWEQQRNAARARIKWMFTTEKARAKMGRAYPKPQAKSGQPKSQNLCAEVLVANQKSKSTATRTELEQGTCAALTKMEVPINFWQCEKPIGAGVLLKTCKGCDAATIAAEAVDWARFRHEARVPYCVVVGDVSGSRPNARNLYKSDLHSGPDVLQRHWCVAEHDDGQWNEQFGVERRFGWRQFEWRQFERRSRRARRRSPTPHAATVSPWMPG